MSSTTTALAQARFRRHARNNGRQPWFHPGHVSDLAANSSYRRRIKPMNHEAKAGLARLLLRCPEHRQALRLVASTRAMSDICESYEQVWQAALYWAGVPGREAAEVAADFRRLITALEEEALSITELRVQRRA